MIRSTLFLAACFAGAFYWSRSLDESKVERRRASSQVAAFVTPETRESLVVAGVSLTPYEAPQAPILYVRSKGQWRCLSVYGAPASEPVLAEIMTKVLDAEGVVQSDNPSRAGVYGFDGPRAIRIAFHGKAMNSREDRDVQLEFDVGDPFPSGTQCYVRRVGSDEIWAIDKNLRVELGAGPLRGLPPALDPHLLPATWIGAAGELQRIQIARRAGTGESLELQRRVVERTEEELAGGLPPWEWILNPGPGQQALSPLRVWGYLRFFPSVPYRGILGPEELPEDRNGRARATLVIYTDNQPPAQLQIFDRKIVSGGVSGYPVANYATGVVYLITQEIYDLLLPDSAVLLDSGASPWQPYLQESIPGVGPQSAPSGR